MKKTIFALLALALFVSCNKEATRTPLVSVRFSVGEYGYFPTKGMSEAISATLPTTLDLTLKNNDTGVTYTTTTGASIEVPVGTYTITGGYTPEATKQVAGSAVFLSHSPKVKVSEQVEILVGKTDYNLSASYESVALVVVSSEITRWIGSTSNKEGFDVQTMTEGQYEWTFLSGDLSVDKRFQTTLYPSDGTQQKSFTIVGNPELQMNFTDALVVEPGKWYILRVSDTEIQTGSFSVSFPEWTQG